MRQLQALLILLIILCITGCTFTTSDRSSNLNEDYRTGTRGITMNFVYNVPPSTMYDSDPFAIILEVKNEGATNIDRGSNSYVYLSGFDSTIITGIGSTGKPIEDLEGKSRYNPHGDMMHIDFDGNIRDLSSKNIDTYDVNLLATACYSYETIAQGLVCLDPEPYSKTSKEKVCTGSTNPSMGSQGGPIQVSSINVEPLPGRTKFTIQVTNLGGGTVFKNGYSYLTKCNPYSGDGLEYNEIDIVQITQVKVNNRDITGTCKPLRNSELRLINGVGKMVCEITDLSGPAITTPITVHINYGYRQSIMKSIQIIATSDN
jgi:hypothetical protein